MNQHDRRTGKGLEHEFFRSVNRLEKMMAGFGAPEPRTWWVSIRFQRPLPDWKRTAPDILTFLEAAKCNLSDIEVRQDFGPNLELTLNAASQPLEDAFMLASIHDMDGGGLVVAEVHRSLLHCVSEKSRKIASVRHKYPEWWLLLVDHVGYGMSELSRQQFRDSVSIEHDWDRVILVNPTKPESYFELDQPVGA